jgi:hypothetical protein
LAGLEVWRYVASTCVTGTFFGLSGVQNSMVRVIASLLQSRSSWLALCAAPRGLCARSAQPNAPSQGPANFLACAFARAGTFSRGGQSTVRTDRGRCATPGDGGPLRHRGELASCSRAARNRCERSYTRKFIAGSVYPPSPSLPPSPAASTKTTFPTTPAPAARGGPGARAATLHIHIPQSASKFPRPPCVFSSAHLFAHAA